MSTHRPHGARAESPNIEYVPVENNAPEPKWVRCPFCGCDFEDRNPPAHFRNEHGPADLR
jgi:hypothetical protein